MIRRHRCLQPTNPMRRKSAVTRPRRPAAGSFRGRRRRSTASAKTPTRTTTTSRNPDFPPGRYRPTRRRLTTTTRSRRNTTPAKPYAADDYYDDAPSPRRRSGVVVVMAILSLAVVGTAGAFGYRAMFGGSVLPTLPPDHQSEQRAQQDRAEWRRGPSEWPIQARRARRPRGSTENLVSREEQPVNMEPPKAAPRVVSTIPIINGQGSVPPGMATPGTSDTAAIRREHPLAAGSFASRCCRPRPRCRHRRR
jgi:hypothetical protein